MAQGADTCSRNTKIAKIMLLTCINKILENHAFNALQMVQGFFIVFAHYRPSYIFL